MCGERLSRCDCGSITGPPLPPPSAEQRAAAEAAYQAALVKEKEEAQAKVWAVRLILFPGRRKGWLGVSGFVPDKAQAILLTRKEAGDRGQEWKGPSNIVMITRDFVSYHPV